MMSVVLASTPTIRWSVALFIVGLSLLSLPWRMARRRLTQVVRVSWAGKPQPDIRRMSAKGVPVLGLALLLPMVILWGPALAVACGLVSLAIGKFWSSQRHARAELTQLSELETAVRTMADELRVGTHPVTAVEAAAEDSADTLAQKLRAVATAERLGIGTDVIPAPAKRGAYVDEVLTQIAAAWMLARRHGVPLVGVIEAVQHDVESTSRMIKQTETRIAGPRTSAAVLAVLPLAGIALGEAMNAGPLGVLLTTSTGQILLVAGAGLIAVGVWWSMALTERVHR